MFRSVSKESRLPFLFRTHEIRDPIQLKGTLVGPLGDQRFILTTTTRTEVLVQLRHDPSPTWTEDVTAYTHTRRLNLDLP